MSAVFDEQDARVLQEVRGMWSRLDPVPSGLRDRVSYVMTVRLLEAEVAELTAMPELAHRSETAEQVRSLSFAGSLLSLLVTFTEEEGRMRVDGWATRGGALVELTVDGQVFTAVADHNGRLVLPSVPSGQAHFVMWTDAERTERPAITPCFDL